MFGILPSKSELEGFKKLLNEYRILPTGFVRDVILKAPSRDVMNSLARSVLTLYSYDANADDTSVENVLRQSLQLIATFPMLALYSYQAFKHYHDFGDLLIRTPNPEYTTAQNILNLLRPDGKFTDIEAKALDLCLVIHADHGGGNNSAFTTHVVTSTGTDTYSAIAAALGSLKGPRHGGANIKVIKMIDDIKEHVADWEDEEAIKNYLNDILDKKAFDKSGLIYGAGHAVYSLSDPRAKVFKSFVEKLAEENGKTEEFKLYDRIEKLAPEVIMARRRVFKGVCVNVDFYSGFVYRMLGLPPELFTPIFAIARISGWCAHRIEEIVNMGKIIRPAYKNVAKHRKYIPIDERN
jgi:citrate synthase